MKFILADDYGVNKDKIYEFDSLEEFAKWTNDETIARFVLIPPHTKRHAWSGVENNTDYWLIWTYPDYD